jgi:hypothetical protein
VKLVDLARQSIENFPSVQSNEDFPSVSCNESEQTEDTHDWQFVQLVGNEATHDGICMFGNTFDLDEGNTQAQSIASVMGRETSPQSTDVHTTQALSIALVMMQTWSQQISSLCKRSQVLLTLVVKQACSQRLNILRKRC